MFRQGFIFLGVSQVVLWPFPVGSHENGRKLQNLSNSKSKSSIVGVSIIWINFGLSCTLNWGKSLNYHFAAFSLQNKPSILCQLHSTCLCSQTITFHLEQLMNFNWICWKKRHVSSSSMAASSIVASYWDLFSTSRHHLAKVQWSKINSFNLKSTLIELVN